MIINRTEIKKILEEKNSPICHAIAKYLDIFNENEIQQIYLILHQTDIEKLKELFLYQNAQTQALLDRIISVAHELSQVEKHVEDLLNQGQTEHLESLIENNIELQYSIS